MTRLSKESKQKLIDVLVSYGVEPKQARATALTVILALRFDELDWHGVYRLLATQRGFDAFDAVTLTQIASEWLRTYIAESQGSHLARWAGLMMYVRDSQETAADWLRSRGYFDERVAQ